MLLTIQVTWPNQGVSTQATGLAYLECKTKNGDLFAVDCVEHGRDNQASKPLLLEVIHFENLPCHNQAKQMQVRVTPLSCAIHVKSAIHVK
jgi:hypothetical protein